VSLRVGTPIRGVRVLGGTTYEDAKLLWKAASNSKSERKQELAKRNINKHARKVWGITMTTKPTLRVGTTSEATKR